MECFKNCFGQQQEQNEIKLNNANNINNILKNSKSNDNKEAENTHENLYLSLQGEIEEMKQKINDITNSTKEIEELKEITSGLKNIENGDEFSKVVKTVTSTLSNALNALKTSKANEAKLSKSLDEANNQINKLNTEIAIKDQKANILAQTNIVDDSIIPTMMTNDMKNKGFHIEQDRLGNNANVYFLSNDSKTLLKGEKLATGYKSSNFCTANFYRLDGDTYKPINNLSEIAVIKDEIILAHQKVK